MMNFCKPSGTVSQLCDTASGIHGRFSPYYIRTVRADVKDPLCKVLIEAGVPHEEAIGNENVLVFSFPKKSPDGAKGAMHYTSVEQAKLSLLYQEHFTEHKVSQTVYYTDKEFLELGQFIYNNFDKIGGISFLPYDGGSYQQAPYQAISEEKYNELLAKFPTDFNWNIVEHTDVTEGVQTLSCTGGSCEIV